MVTFPTLRVGSRNSPLSMTQTDEALSLMRPIFPDVRFDIVPISTEGDRNKESPLQSLGRGTFVKEIEQALLDEEIDFAVHSAKDLTVEVPDGLTAMAAGSRHDPRDVLINRWGLPLKNMPKGARLGTSSPRRTALIKSVRSDLDVRPIRGNVGTRLDKAISDSYDGVVAAAAGVLRLGRDSEICEYLDPEVFTPEVGQGTLAVEARRDDETTINMLTRVADNDTSIALTAERGFLSYLGVGCTIPTAAYARVTDTMLTICSMAALPDGSKVFRATTTAPCTDPDSTGREVAQRLLDAGAKEISLL